jgi:hypothetical protein
MSLEYHTTFMTANPRGNVPIGSIAFVTRVVYIFRKYPKSDIPPCHDLILSLNPLPSHIVEAKVFITWVLDPTFQHLRFDNMFHGVPRRQYLMIFDISI